MSKLPNVSLPTGPTEPSEQLRVLETARYVEGLIAEQHAANIAAGITSAVMHFAKRGAGGRVSLSCGADAYALPPAQLQRSTMAPSGVTCPACLAAMGGDR